MVIQCLYSVVSFFFQIDVSGSKMARKDSQPDPAHGAEPIQGHRPVPCAARGTPPGGSNTYQGPALCDGSSEDEPEHMELEEGQIPVCILLRET